MIYKEGSAEQIHNWFITESTQEIVLCIFLGVSNRDVTILSDLIDEVTHVDAIAGEKIGFLLCSQNTPNSLLFESRFSEEGTRIVINGKYKTAHRNAISAKDFISDFDVESLRRYASQPADITYYQDAKTALARSTSRLAPDLMNLYGVSHEELPCLVTLTKGVSTFNVTRCPRDLRKEDLLTWLSSVRGIVNQVERDLLLKDFFAMRILEPSRKAVDNTIEINAKIKKIQSATIGIMQKYKVPLEVSVHVVNSLSSDRLYLEEKAEVIRIFFDRCPDTSKDSRWEKILRLQERVDELRLKEFEGLDLSALKPLAQKLNDELEKLEQITQAIAKLKFKSVSSRSSVRTLTPRTARSAWEKIDRVNLAVDVMDKTKRALDYLSRLFL